MKKSFLSLVLMFTTIVVLTGCRGALVYNIMDAPVTPTSAHEPTLEQVTQAILAARKIPKPAWRMKVIEPGFIRGTLNIRTHSATVDIKYTTTSYSITYISSSNLKYSEKKNTIHKNYNSWIQNLDNAINMELSDL